MKKTWKHIFEELNNNKKINSYSLKNLLILAGHMKSKTGSFGLRKWNKEINRIKEKINKPGGNILEIGCGNGEILKSFQEGS
jgi:ubiquinone/menaquinone biosynthesis C-methylase UbiE